MGLDQHYLDSLRGKFNLSGTQFAGPSYHPVFAASEKAFQEREAKGAARVRKRKGAAKEKRRQHVLDTRGHLPLTARERYIRGAGDFNEQTMRDREKQYDRDTATRSQRKTDVETRRLNYYEQAQAAIDKGMPFTIGPDGLPLTQKQVVQAIKRRRAERSAAMMEQKHGFRQNKYEKELSPYTQQGFNVTGTEGYFPPGSPELLQHQQEQAQLQVDQWFQKSPFSNINDQMELWKQETGEDIYVEAVKGVTQEQLQALTDEQITAMLQQKLLERVTQRAQQAAGIQPQGQPQLSQAQVYGQEHTQQMRELYPGQYPPQTPEQTWQQKQEEVDRLHGLIAQMKGIPKDLSKMTPHQFAVHQRGLEGDARFQARDGVMGGGGGVQGPDQYGPKGIQAARLKLQEQADYAQRARDLGLNPSELRAQEAGEAQQLQVAQHLGRQGGQATQDLTDELNAIKAARYKAIAAENLQGAGILNEEIKRVNDLLAKAAQAAAPQPPPPPAADPTVRPEFLGRGRPYWDQYYKPPTTPPPGDSDTPPPGDRDTTTHDPNARVIPPDPARDITPTPATGPLPNAEQWAKIDNSKELFAAIEAERFNTIRTGSKGGSPAPANDTARQRMLEYAVRNNLTDNQYSRRVRPSEREGLKTWNDAEFRAALTEFAVKHIGDEKEAKAWIIDFWKEAKEKFKEKVIASRNKPRPKP